MKTQTKISNPKNLKELEDLIEKNDCYEIFVNKQKIYNFLESPLKQVRIMLYEKISNKEVSEKPFANYDMEVTLVQHRTDFE